ncbi:MAG TPA: hypothetical protein DCX22_00205 [Dehalococcoidia bacterium]|nr:hypothetical protein [Dehalococcoidia bacterium]
MMKSMYFRFICLFSILIGLIAVFGCDAARGGATVYLEGVNMGAVSMEGKPLTGLPSSKVNVVLKVSANQVRISQANGKTTIKLLPSGATVVTSAEGISFTGVKTEQVEMQWPQDQVAQ